MSEHSFIDPTRTRRHRGYRHPLARLLLGVAVAVVMVGARPGAGSWARSPVKLRLGGQLPFTRGQLVRKSGETWTAQQIAAGMNAYLNGLPEPLYALFGTGYLGYTAARQWGKVKGVER